MIDFEIWHRIQKYQQEGLKAGQIARKLAIDPRTVEKWLQEDRYRQRASARRKSKLDPYKDQLLSLLEKHPYSVTQLFQRIREDGYPGSYELLKEYVRKVRPQRAPAFLTLSFAPGDCIQMDWGQYKTIGVGSTRRKLYFFVMVLCHSRMMYVEFTLSQSMEHFLACHINAFQYFGAVSEHVMIDNLRTGVLSCRPGEDKVFNPRYQDFARHFGFQITACNVGKGNEKGRVENAVGYVKKNFLHGLELDRFDQLNPAIRYWLDQVANARTHRETRQRPKDLLAEDLAAMHPLPAQSYDVARVKPVRATRLFRVVFETNRYSVPAEYASQSLTLKIRPDQLCIYHQDQLIAQHPRCFDRHQDIEDPDHPKALLAQRRRAEEQKLLQRFIALSPKAGDYYQQLERKRLNVKVHVRRIIALSEIYGREATARAMEDAFTYQAFSSEYIANLLEQRAQTPPVAGTLHVTHREDLLRLHLESPDLSIYTPATEDKNS